jgi:hypothetical protein
MATAELRVAMDIGSKKHQVGIGGADGRVLEEFEITHDKDGFARFFNRVEAVAQRLNLPVVAGAIKYSRATPTSLFDEELGSRLRKSLPRSDSTPGRR